jgi:hypothetical protein
MIFVNASERVVDLIKKDGGLFVVSPCMKINMAGHIEQTRVPVFVPVFGILAVVEGYVMLNNSSRAISHVRLCANQYVPENNFIIANIVALDEHVLVFSISHRYPDDFIINRYYDFVGKMSLMQESGEERKNLFQSLPPNKDAEHAICYYGINEYRNLQRWAGSNVTSLQAFPRDYTGALVGDSKVNQERAANAMANPFRNEYLIHHTGFMQDALPTHDQINGINEMEENPNQYYSTEDRGFVDETWNFADNENMIKNANSNSITPRQVTTRLRDATEDRTDDSRMVPVGAYKGPNGIIVEYKDPNTGDIIPISYEE